MGHELTHGFDDQGMNMFWKYFISKLLQFELLIICLVSVSFTIPVHEFTYM